MVARRQSQKYECNVGVRKHTLRWQEWFPGLDNDHETLGDVLATLPASPPTAIPWIVRLLENPNGWLHLHGAVDLGVHDSDNTRYTARRRQESIPKKNHMLNFQRHQLCWSHKAMEPKQEEHDKPPIVFRNGDT